MRICFYSEYKNTVGGVTTLIINLIKELYRRDIAILLFNYKDGMINSELNNANVNVELIDIGTLNFNEINKYVSDKDVFVIFSFLEAYHHFLKVNPKLIYYNINDTLCEIGRYKFGINTKGNSKKLIDTLVKKKALALMDDTGSRSAVKKLKLIIYNPFFLPIPVAVPTQNNYLLSSVKIASEIKFSYIGRSVDWKIFPLKKILDDIVSVKGMGKKIIFSIVVDDIEALLNMLDIRSYEHYNFIKIKIVEKLLPSEIKQFLLQNADISFGMGTTALESAQTGIPTILMDYAFNEFPPGYKYKWLYETECFSLGKNLNDTVDKNSSGLTMGELLHNISENNAYLSLQSENNFTYIMQNHCVDKVVDRLIMISTATAFSFKDAKKHILFYWRFHQGLKKILFRNGQK